MLGSKTIVEDAGVMPNPTVDKLREGVAIAKKNKTDLLLAVGGGSCCDYAKAVSVSVHCDEDPWEKYYLRFVSMSLSELGATEDMTEGIADGTFILEGGYKVLTRDEVVKILKESL